SPTSATARISPGGSRIGRPPQWTISRSRKLARLYVYTTLSIEKIIKVLENDVFKPRQGTRESSTFMSHHHVRTSRRTNIEVKPPQTAIIGEEFNPLSTVPSSTSGSGSNMRSTPSFEFGTLSPSTSSSGITEGLRRLSIPMWSVEQENTRGGSFDSGSFGVREVQRRVSDCSTNYARQISTLLKRFSISSSSEPEDDEQQQEYRPSSGGSTDSEPAAVSEAFPEPGFALPGDFLGAHSRNCAEFPGQEHGSGTCWCSIARETSSLDGSWLLSTGELGDLARVILDDPSKANIFMRDCFGNTPLHLFASMEGYREVLLGMVLHSDSVRTTNNASQTFLHVLNVEWFSDLDSPSALLKQLLAFLAHSAPDLVYDTDVYGRNFFHRAHSLIHDEEILAGLLSPFNPIAASRRDAFGFNPLANTQLGGEGPFIPPRRVGSRSPSEEDSTPTRPGSRPSSADEVSFLAYHARLVQVIQSSYNNARVEDVEGRNGLHCLAEAIINQQTMDEQRSAISTGRPMKRKLDTKDTGSVSPIASTSTTSVGSSSNAEGTLVARLRHVEGLTIHSAHPVDINHYDKHGNTVLMAFIKHISDAQDDKSKTLMTILETLIRAGVRLEARNRRGETALLVAARLGRKTALTTLLEHGANVYARDVDGRGVLEVIDETCRRARSDVSLYARLEACRVLLTGRRDWGVVLKPSIVSEWRTREGVYP
ncbi:hypothetical protein B0H66DRAFT_628507, partial [Apodospora peruviana]